MQHRGLWPYIVYPNDDLGLTLTFLGQGQICFLMLLYGENIHSFRKHVRESFNGRNLQQMTRVTRVYVDLKLLIPRDCLSLSQGYIHV